MGPLRLVVELADDVGVGGSEAGHEPFGVVVLLVRLRRPEVRQQRVAHAHHGGDAGRLHLSDHVGGGLRFLVEVERVVHPPGELVARRLVELLGVVGALLVPGRVGHDEADGPGLRPHGRVAGIAGWGLAEALDDVVDALLGDPRAVGQAGPGIGGVGLVPRLRQVVGAVADDALADQGIGEGRRRSRQVGEGLDLLAHGQGVGVGLLLVAALGPGQQRRLGFEEDDLHLAAVGLVHPVEVVDEGQDGALEVGG